MSTTDSTRNFSPEAMTYLRDQQGSEASSTAARVALLLAFDAGRESADALLAKVSERLGGLGLDIDTFADGTVEVRWKRDYGGEWSDERFTSAPSLLEALQGMLDREDEIDAEEAREETR